MRFAESDSVLHETIPVWAEYLIRFGYECASNKNDWQRISLISMPCNSPGAGLVALGAMRYFLDAKYHYSDDDIHYWLENEKSRALFCGSDRFRYIENDAGKTVVEEIILSDNRRNPGNPRMPKRRTAFLKDLDLRFDKEPILVSAKRKLPYLSIYEQLFPAGSAINDGNLQQSNSSVCLAAKRKGAKITKEDLLHTRFMGNSIAASLHELLSLIDGSLDVVSRVTMYNTRTEKMDRPGFPPEIVVADGIDAFLKITEEMQRSANNDFSECNIVAVIDRTEKREKLDSLQVKASELRQWYEPDTQEYSAPPKGIALATYVRST